MHHFFISPTSIDRDVVTLTGRQAFQIMKVLRLEAGDRVVVLDGNGREYESELLEVKASRVVGRVLEDRACLTEPGLHITVYQALLKGTKLEVVLQKCTEIGASGFVIVGCERCVASDPAPSRWERWNRILVEAAEQSRRGRVPTLRGVVDFAQACDVVEGCAMLPWEGEHNTGIRSVLQGWNAENLGGGVSIFVGPEGGFTEGEVEVARSRGIVPVSLGRRILRAETAGFVAVTASLYEHGDLD